VEVTAAKFKATSLQLLAKASRTGETITVTKRGKPFVRIRVHGDERPKRATIYGALKDDILFAAPSEELLSTNAEWDVLSRK
jgi:antitoxin (DNA-binding transcriptional repressor) of toxin-antitoxin stability system